MKHILSIWLPHLPIERLKQQHYPPHRAARQPCSPGATPPEDKTQGAKAEPAFVLTAVEKNAIRLTAVNETARRDGLTPGMALTDARARMPGLITAPAQPEADARLLRALALWCTQYTPWVNTDGVDGLFLDITGCGHLFGGELALTESLVRRLNALGYTARAGLGETPGAAWGLARYGATPFTQLATPEARQAAFRQLPIEALRLTPATLTVLSRLGLKQVGAVERIPRAALVRRFRSRHEGEAVRTRLDQAFALISEPVAPIAPPAFHRTRLTLPEPIMTREAIDASLNRLLAGLTKSLEADQLGARALSFALYRTDGTAKTIRITSSRASRGTEHFYTLFKEHLGTIDPGFGIDTLILNADRTEPLTAAQAAFGEEHSQNAQEGNCARLIDRLANRLGHKNVYCLSPQESHIPERAQVRTPALSSFTQRKKPSWDERDETHAPGTGRLKTLPDRPARLFERPEPIDVIAEVPDGPPLSFSWRRRVRRIAFAAGPERIAPEWWRNPALSGAQQPGQPLHNNFLRTRDYYKIEDDHGQLYWVFRTGLYEEERQDLKRQGAPLWYIHGLFT